jgi:hypothetical protein
MPARSTRCSHGTPSTRSRTSQSRGERLPTPSGRGFTGNARTALGAGQSATARSAIASASSWNRATERWPFARDTRARNRCACASVHSRSTSIAIPTTHGSVTASSSDCGSVGSESLDAAVVAGDRSMDTAGWAGKSANTTTPLAPLERRALSQPSRIPSRRPMDAGPDIGRRMQQRATPRCLRSGRRNSRSPRASGTHGAVENRFGVYL